MKYFVLIHQDSPNNDWGECLELPGCFSQDNTSDELMENMKEAITLYVQESNFSDISNQISEVRELVI